jgi:C1A family cysteine protease
VRIALQRTIVACLAAAVCCLAAAAAPAASAAGEPAGIREAPVAPGVAQPQAAPLVYAYPAAFDLRDEEKVSPVEDQGLRNTCWAFAALGSLESTLLPDEVWDFSEDNMVWYSGFDDAGYKHGGTSLMATAYLSRWGGPFTEDQDAYDDGVHPAPSTLALQKHVQDVIYLPARTSPDNNDDIKYAVYNWGGVYITLYVDGFNPGDPYWNDAENAYCYRGSSVGANHGVLIVGWDDEYPAANFAASHRPPGDGAFLVKNSWGKSFGDNGYFWLSYYDRVVGRDGTTSVFLAAEPTDSLHKVYQRDPLGYAAYVRPRLGDQTDWFANRFVATASDDLTAVSFWTLGPNASYQLYAGPSLDELTSVGGGTIERTGYHTVRFSTPYLVTLGSPFYVAVKLTVPDSDTSTAWPKIALEDRLPYYSSAATAGPQQSYIKTSGSTWVDLVRISPSFAHANVCLKAFTGGMDGPHTSVSGADTRWHNAPVTLTFTGTAPDGVASPECSIDDGQTWVPGDSCPVEAPADGSNDGIHTVAYRSVGSNATEAFHTVAVKIDTQPPVTKAPRSASVRRYHSVTLRYRVNDLPKTAKTATVTIRIKTLGGATKKVLRLGSRTTNTDQTVAFHCSLVPRTYRFYVYAVDPAGNVQKTAGSNRLTVR